jgi:hypothetical protein
MTMKHKFCSRIGQTDYEEMRRRCSDLPASYGEWLAQQGLGKERSKKTGYIIIDVLISPQEIGNYCKAMRLRPDTLILGQFAVTKHINNSKRMK